MSLRPHAEFVVPTETARVAHAAFPNGTRCLRIADRLGTIFCDADFTALFPPQGQPALTPVRLALVTVLQFVEGLSDRQAADAVRSRIDWKYLLCLELTDPGFDFSVLSEFRSRLVAANAEALVFDLLLGRLCGEGLVKGRGRQRTDSTHVLAAVRAMNRLECVVETMRHALTSLAAVVPEWLREHVRAEWVDRYDRRADDYRLLKGDTQREAYAEQVGADGWELLSAVCAPNAPDWLARVPAVETMRQVWVQQFLVDDGTVRWRHSSDTPPSSRMISSPYDTEAHYARKRSTSWIGYRVHLTETCDDESPRFITHVETVCAPEGDADAIPPIHEALAEKDLLPSRHLVDTGYVEAKLLVSEARTRGVDLYGPTRSDYHWQSNAGLGFAAMEFAINWDKQEATCPAGKTSLSWTPAIDRGDNEVVKIKFSRKDCRPCPSRFDCTTSARHERRTITIRTREAYEALQAARSRQKTEEFKSEYGTRAGVEGTISQGVRAFGLRRGRYIGFAKTALQHLMTGAAINLARLDDWIAGVPRETTRLSAFQLLMAAPSSA